MISAILIVVFVLGYVAIALEHNIHIDKAASALLTGTICWALFVLGFPSSSPPIRGFLNFHARA